MLVVCSIGGGRCVVQHGGNVDSPPDRPNNIVWLFGSAGLSLVEWRATFNLGLRYRADYSCGLQKRAGRVAVDDYY